MLAKKEKLIKITKDEDGSEVRVYKKFDQENPYLTGEPRFVHKENENAEEVEMQPFEINVDKLSYFAVKKNQKHTLITRHPAGSLALRLLYYTP